MDAKTAIETAKTTLRSVFENEILGEVKLEEVEFEPTQDVWAITLSFARQFRPSETEIENILQLALRNVTMKVVRVPNSVPGSVSIKNYP